MEEKPIDQQRKILICSAAWKESFTPSEANGIITDVLQTRRPQWHLQAMPLSDGGDGWLEVVAQLPIGKNSIREAVQVTGPLPNRTLTTHFRWSGTTAFVEAADIHGMRRLPGGIKDPMQATSYGVGEVLLSLAPQHPEIRKAILSVGGSASVDGGMGLLQAWGWRFLNQQGNPITHPLGGGSLAAVHQIIPPATRPTLPDLTVLVDVSTPYLEAPQVFGPQKGATPQQVLQLTQGFQQVLSCLPQSGLADLPGSGAAGGLSFGVLQGCPGARLETGMDWYARATHLDQLWDAVDWVITGEGRLDDTSMLGKGTGYLINKAINTGKPLTLFCGQNTLTHPLPEPVQVVPLFDADQPITPQMIQQCRTALTNCVAEALSAIG